MRLFEFGHPPTEKLKHNQFKSSLIRGPLYHGTQEKFSKFLRPTHGIYVTPWREWADNHYGSSVITLYANIKKIKKYIVG